MERPADYRQTQLDVGSLVNFLGLLLALQAAVVGTVELMIPLTHTNFGAGGSTLDGRSRCSDWVRGYHDLDSLLFLLVESVDGR